MLMTICESMSFDFSTIIGTGDQTIVLADAIDITNMMEGGLNVRVESLNLNGGSISVLVYGCWPDSRDSTVYSNTAALAACDLTSTAVNFYSTSLDFSSQRPPAVRVVVYALQPAGRITLNCKITVGLVALNSPG